VNALTITVAGLIVCMLVCVVGAFVIDRAENGNWIWQERAAQRESLPAAPAGFWPTRGTLDECPYGCGVACEHPELGGSG
jgi:hypothetical protein